MTEHLPMISATMTVVIFLFGLGAWMVKQLKSERDNRDVEVNAIYLRIHEMETQLEEKIEKTNNSVIDSNKQLAVIQETLRGLSVQIGAFAEISTGMIKNLTEHSEKIGVITARCDAIQSTKT